MNFQSRTSVLLKDGMNDYLNAINELRPAVWRHDPVSINKENFIVLPFIDLLLREEYAVAQLIASGASFSGLEGVHRKRLDHVYAAK